MFNTWKSCIGFTLVEVLIAIIILTVGLLGLSVITISVIANIQFSKQTTIATTLAQDRLEEIQNEPYEDVIEDNYPIEAYNTIAEFPQFERTVTVTERDNNTKKEITVTVSWNRSVTGSGITRNVDLSTIIRQQ